MIKNGLVLHASGDRKMPFIDGYYFYYAPECTYISNTLHVSYIVEVHVCCMFILNPFMFVMIYSFILFLKYFTSVYMTFLVHSSIPLLKYVYRNIVRFNLV